MNHHYEPEFKQIIVHLHLENERPIKSIASKYDVSHASISNWTNQFRTKYHVNEKAQSDYDCIEENLKLEKQLAELQ